MVVDHVEDHADALGVSGVDEASESVRTAVGVLDRPRKHAVVPPVPAAGELRDGHELDPCDPERRQPRQLGDGRIERGALGEGADVQFVQHLGNSRVETAPARIGPDPHRRVDECGGSEGSLGLPPASRVGQRDTAVESEPVALTVLGVDRGDVRAAGCANESNRVRSFDQKIDGGCMGSPDRKIHPGSLGVQELGWSEWCHSDQEPPTDAPDP